MQDLPQNSFPTSVTILYTQEEGVEDLLLLRKETIQITNFTFNTNALFILFWIATHLETSRGIELFFHGMIEKKRQTNFGRGLKRGNKNSKIK